MKYGKEHVIMLTYESETRTMVRYVDDIGGTFGRGVFMRRDELPHPIPRKVTMTLSFS